MARPKIRFTKKTVADLKPEAAPYAVTDATIERGIGFQVRVFPNGRKAFQVRFRATAGGPETLQTIGDVDGIDLADARERAREIVRRAKSDPDAATSSVTWREALETLERNKLTGGGGAEILRTLRRECAPWNARRVRAITKSDIKSVLNEIEDRGALVQRNRTLTYIKLAFSYFMARGYTAENPARDLTIDRTAEKPSQRYLSIPEMRLVWRAAFELDEGARRRGVWGDLFALLILTGARLSEVAGMVVDEVDLSSKVWEIPAARMKADEPHAIPLAPVPLAILTRRINAAKEAGETLVFTSNGNTPPSGWSKIKREIDERVAKMNSGKSIPEWKIHSIRHGFRTGLARIGVPPHIAELCLAHKVRGIGKIYDHHIYLDERRVGLEDWAKEVQPRAGEGFTAYDMWSAREREQSRIGALRATRGRR